MADLIDFLRKLKYLVKVEKITRGCCAVYPKQPVEIHTYFVTQNGFEFSKNGQEITEFIGPNYAISPAICLHIYKNCNKIRYDTSLIEYNNGERVEYFEQLLDVDCDKHKQYLMFKLLQIIYNQQLTPELKNSYYKLDLFAGLSLMERIFNVK